MSVQLAAAAGAGVDRRPPQLRGDRQGRPDAVAAAAVARHFSTSSPAAAAPETFAAHREHEEPAPEQLTSKPLPSGSRPGTAAAEEETQPAAMSETNGHQPSPSAASAGPSNPPPDPGPDAAQPDSDSASTHAPSSFSLGLSIDNSDSGSDADSALGSLRAQSSSMSASSSIFDFVQEHGRTWHRYHEGKYFMPNDIPEQERLDLQHSIAVRLFDGLYLAPVGRPNRVLDIGTGTGIWAIEFATEHPESDVLGTDLSPIQPEYVPPNCRFEVDDAEDEWVFSDRFDFIHSRYMSGSISDFPGMFAMCYENLTPGGWVEFQDYYVKLQCMDASLAGTALERWNDCIIEGVRRMGKNALACARYKAQLAEAGFVDVTERKFALPGNSWAKGDDQKMLGTMQLENILQGLHAFSIGLFTKMLGMGVEEVELMLVDVRKDLRNTKIHFYYIV